MDSTRPMVPPVGHQIQVDAPKMSPESVARGGMERRRFASDKNFDQSAIVDGLSCGITRSQFEDSGANMQSFKIQEPVDSIVDFEMKPAGIDTDRYYNVL